MIPYAAVFTDMRMPYPRIDLHMHSTASDGTLPPSQLWAKAQQAGLSLWALTDHDTLAGYEALQAETAAEAGPRLLSGLEWSARWAGGDVHIVALGVDTQHAGLQAALESQQALRPERAARIAAKLERCGLPDALASALTLANGGSVGRVHFARHLVQRGAVAAEQEAFRRYLGQGAPAYVNCDWPDMSRVIEQTRAAGGVAVLAHPMKYRLTRTKLRRLVLAFAEAGGEAVEWPYLPDADTARWLSRLVRECDLSLSVGSDFHGSDAGWNRVGRVSATPPDCRQVWERWLP